MGPRHFEPRPGIPLDICLLSVGRLAPILGHMARLDPEQEQTLITIVELVRSVPRTERHSFILSEDQQGADILMPGARSSPKVLAADVRELQVAGLLRLAPGGSRYNTAYDVTGDGFAHYDELMRGTAGPTAAVEANVVSYLDGPGFASRHRDSYAKWITAANDLRGDDTESRMTTIGHHAREAMMTFTTELVGRYKVTDANPDPERTVSRLRSVIAKAAPRLGETERPMLEALVEYWGTIHDLATRQEHGAAKSVPLVAEDARRVVFQTAMVMFELDRAFVRALG